MISYRVTAASQLPEQAWSRWAEIQSGQPELDSPFFSPELARLTSLVRDDVEVATIHDGEELAGFFPFQRTRENTAQAITGRLSEFHGAVYRPGIEWSPDALLRACGLRAWHFDHLPVNQAAFSTHIWGTTTSPCMDLSQGYGAWREQVRQQGSTVTQVERKARKLEREVGPLRFEYRTPSAEVFAALVEWKTGQHERTSVLPIFRTPWVVNLLEALRTHESPGFIAPLSALYAGDQLLAVHLGLQSRNALHIWFPSYDPEFDKYSPGLVLLLNLAEEAAERGINRIDFGRGEERYKQSLKTGDVLIAEGKVSRHSVGTAVHAAWYRTKRRIRESRWRQQLELPLTLTRRLRQRAAFR
ncbi:MAG: GNAT family N-acetyltransferase [Planctomycetaceae bacterium]|nr:GNAT family N-acetyltransferase [Planctomycetaceae bacterium]